MKINFKKYSIAIQILFFSVNSFSQTIYTTIEGVKTKTKSTFTQFDISIPLQSNPNREQNYLDEKRNNSWFLPDGLSSSFGYGIHYNNWISVAIHSGIDWKISESLVVAPIFANFKLNPKLGIEPTRLVAQLGYGKSFALGRGNLTGIYKKLCFGVQTNEDLLIYIQIAEYGFPLHNQKNVGSISLGISLITY
jgi:hypothetical protein